MQPISAISDEKVRKWLEFSPHAWENLGHDCCAAADAVLPSVIELEERLGQLQWVFAELDEDDLAISFEELAGHIDEYRKAVAAQLRNGATKALPEQKTALVKLLSKMQEKETQTVTYLKKHLASGVRSAGLWSWSQTMFPRLLKQWPKLRTRVTELWSTYVAQAQKQLEVLTQELKSEPAVEDKLARAAAQLQVYASEQLAETVRDLATAVVDRRQQVLGKYLENIVPLTTNTVKFILGTLAQDDPRVAELLQEQDDVHNLRLWGAEVRDPILLEQLKRFTTTSKRGKFTYTTYRMDDEPVVYYDGWMIAAREEPLQAISSGDILMQTTTAELKLPLKPRAQQRTAAGPVLRCTFTSNAGFDDVFLDWLRQKGSTALGTNTWNIPVGSSDEVEQLRAVLERDWGYPYVWEHVESPSMLHELYDVAAPGRAASVVRTFVLHADAITFKQGDYITIRSASFPSWLGGCWRATPTGVKVAEQRVAQYRLLAENLDNSLDVKKCAAVANKLQVAADTIADDQLSAKLSHLATDTLVVGSLIVSEAITSTPQGTLCTPTVGSTLILGGVEYDVMGHIDNPYGWLELQADDRTPYVLLKPDLRSKVALVTPEEYAKYADFRSASTLSTFTPQGQLFQATSNVSLLIDNKQVLLDEDTIKNVLSSLEFDEDDDEELVNCLMATDVPVFPLPEGDLLERLKYKGDKLEEDQEENPDQEITIHETLAASPMGGYPVNNFLTEQRSLPIVDFPPEGLVYQTPPARTLVPYNSPYDPNVEPKSKRERGLELEIFDDDQEPIDFFQDSPSSGPTVTRFGPHPDGDKEEIDNGDIPLSYFDPLMILKQYRRLQPGS